MLLCFCQDFETCGSLPRGSRFNGSSVYLQFIGVYSCASSHVLAFGNCNFTLFYFVLHSGVGIASLSKHGPMSQHNFFLGLTSLRRNGGISGFSLFGFIHGSSAWFWGC